MFRLLPWSSSVVGGNKVTAEDVKVLAAPKPKSPPHPVMEPAAALHRLKRKRQETPSEGDGGGGAAPEDNTDRDRREHHPVTKMSMTSRAAATGPHNLGNTNSNTSTVDSRSNDNNDDDDDDDDNNCSNSTRVGAGAELGAKDKAKVEQSATNNSSSSSGSGTTRHRQMDHDTLRETLESQLSLEVLLKHDELRLIDQEIAKCQVALEQLRRCQEIPFPATSSISSSRGGAGLSWAVSSGTGFSTAASPADGADASRLPSSPAPWGVADGPYSRHYARWLLPAQRFDGGEPETPAAALVPPPAGAAGGGGGPAGKGPLEGRTTRASWTDANGQSMPPGQPSSRAQRTTAGSKLQALSSGYPPPKDKAGPMIIKRKSDGQPVKLVCIDCRRDNFSSTQGFINHCRIAHNRSFASHDAAAVASGEPVEVDNNGAVVGAEKGPSSSSSGPPGYVHPLIRSAHLVDSDSSGKPTPRSSSSNVNRPSTTHSPTPAVQQSKDPTKSMDHRRRKDDGSAAATTTSRTPNNTSDDLPLRRTGVTGDINDNPSFKGSPQTPHLSALMQKRGHGLDLLDIVDDALTKSEMDNMYSSGEESGDGGEEAADASGPASKNNDRGPLDARNGPLPTRTVVPPSAPPSSSSSSKPRPGSRKGADKGGRKPRSSISLNPATAPFRSPCTLPPSSPRFTTATPTAAATQQLPPGTEDVEMVDGYAPGLSPNTVESNQAPSLVSDHGEYGGRSESESPIPSSAASNADEASFVDNVEVHQDDGDESNESTTTGSAAADRRPDPGITAQGKGHRPASAAAPPVSASPSTGPVGTRKTKAKKDQRKQAKSKQETGDGADSAGSSGNHVAPGHVAFASPVTGPPPTPKRGNAKRQRRK